MPRLKPPSEQPRRTAVLMFATSHERDRRRRGLSPAAGALIRLPQFPAVAASADLHWFTDLPARQRSGWQVHRQRGSTFRARLENAIDDLAAVGYQRIVVLGRDCPQLTEEDVTAAIASLDQHRLVLGPDHRGGCWLIAFHAADRCLLRNITWQRDTDAQQILARFGPDTTEILQTRIDLDHAGDLRQLARNFAPAAALLRLECGCLPDIAILNPTDSFLRIRHQLPPPLAA